MSQTVQRYRRQKKRRDWRDPFSWFDWFYRDRPTVLAQFSPMGGNQVGAKTFTRADASTCATYVTEGGVVTLAAANVLRDRHYINGQGPYALLEGARTNVCLRSADFANWSTVSGGETLTPAVAAPDGTTTGATLTAGGAGNGIQRAVTFTGDATKAAFIHFKQGTATKFQTQIYDSTAATARHTVTWTWTDGVPVGATTAGSGTIYTAVALANGWYRCAFTAAGVVAANTNRFYLLEAPAASGTVLIWGAQAENAAFPSSYIPTTTAAVTRSADALSFAFNAVPQAMTVHVKMVNLLAADTGNHPRIFQIGASSPLYYGYIQNNLATVLAGHDAVFKVLAVTLAHGDTMEYLAPMSATGAIAAGAAINAGAYTETAYSAADDFAPAWQSQTLVIGNAPDGASPIFAAFASVKLASGVQTMDTMRAL